jgi:transcriptional regulator with GAF, ATPase, and Fis domain
LATSKSDHRDSGAGDIRTTFAQLATLFRDGSSPQETCDAIARAALDVIGGCDHAGVAFLSAKGEFSTLSATDEVVEIADALQRETGEGPCLEASLDEDIKHDADLETAPTWPRFAARLVESTAVRSALACPLVLEGRRSGALNLFADRTAAFTPDDVANAAVLASFASVAVAAALERENSAQLRVALDTNRTIGAAVGILMATHGIAQEDAFSMLSTASQRVNRKLREVAAGIVTGASPQAPDS